jgi:hypothetical protein
MKEDVSRAYRRVRLRPDCCKWMILILPPTADGKQYYAVRLSQPFGHNASAHAWGVVARSLKWQLTRVEHPAAGLRLFDMYVDDLYAFGSEGFLQMLSSRFAQYCVVAGDGARAVEKHAIAEWFASLGWMFNDEHDVVMPNIKGWMNMVALFFNEIPEDIKPGDPLAVTTLLRAGSFGSRYSQAFYVLRPYCHGLYGNVKGAHMNAVRHVSVRTVQDIAMWRMFIRAAHQRMSLLSVPVEWPMVLQWTPVEQAGHADRVLFVDACTSQHMCGAFVEGLLWCQYVCPVLTHMVNSAPVRVDINVFEMLGVVMGVLVVLREDTTVKHIHVWCDNTSSVAWASSNRVDSPLLCFLLQVLTLAAAYRRVLVTVGWIKGEVNIVADAISRNFLVPSGTQIRRSLPLNQCVHPPKGLSRCIKTVSSLRHNVTSVSTRCAHIVLAGTSTRDSAGS